MRAALGACTNGDTARVPLAPRVPTGAICGNTGGKLALAIARGDSVSIVRGFNRPTRDRTLFLRLDSGVDFKVCWQKSIASFKSYFKLRTLALLDSRDSRISGSILVSHGRIGRDAIAHSRAVLCFHVLEVLSTATLVPLAIIPLDPPTTARTVLIPRTSRTILLGPASG